MRMDFWKNQKMFQTDLFRLNVDTILTDAFIREYCTELKTWSC